jgi:hypothetical protein
VERGGALGLEPQRSGGRGGGVREKRPGGKYDPLTTGPTCQVRVGALELGLLLELSLKLELQRVGGAPTQHNRGYE